MDRIVAEKMGVGLDRTEIVDADDLDVVAPGFIDRPQDEPADAPKPVDANPDGHRLLSNPNDQANTASRSSAAFAAASAVMPNFS